MKLALDKRGVYKETKYITTDKAQLVFEIPLGEIIFDFFEKLKSISRGYASFDYEIIGEKESKLQKLDILISGEQVDALSIIVHKDNAYKQLRAKLYELELQQRRLEQHLHLNPPQLSRTAHLAR